MLIMRTICGNLAQTGFFAGMQLPNFVETPTFPLYFSGNSGTAAVPHSASPMGKSLCEIHETAQRDAV